MEILGSLEHLVLLAVRVEVGANGMAIVALLEGKGLTRNSPGSIYTTLDRLTRKKLLKKTVQAARPIRGGRHRYAYTLTASGTKRLEEHSALVGSFDPA